MLVTDARALRALYDNVRPLLGSLNMIITLTNSKIFYHIIVCELKYYSEFKVNYKISDPLFDFSVFVDPYPTCITQIYYTGIYIMSKPYVVQ